jgi:hypothetical protein
MSVQDGLETHQICASKSAGLGQKFSEVFAAALLEV